MYELCPLGLTPAHTVRVACPQDKGIRVATAEETPLDPEKSDVNFFRLGMAALNGDAKLVCVEGMRHWGRCCSKWVALGDLTLGVVLSTGGDAASGGHVSDASRLRSTVRCLSWRW